MTSTFFTCAECGVELTEFLAARPEDSLQLEPGKPGIDAGAFVRLSSPWSYREFVTGRSPGQRYTSADGDAVAFEAGDWLLHIGDVRHGVAADARYGCCGLQPRDESNATCPNGHAIGSIHSDCWAAAVFRLGHARVRAIGD